MPENQLPEIRNIVFDLGGVLLNINPLLSLIEFGKVSGVGTQELIARFTAERIFEKFDTGSLDADQFRSELCRIIAKQVDAMEIDRIWNILLLDFPSSRVRLLQQLRKNYRLFLLSNTNSIHFQKYTHDFQLKYGFAMEELFERLFLSFEIGIHKPDEGIYTHVLREAELNPAETVFFDDSLANIRAAEKLGFRAIHIHDGHSVMDSFENGIFKPV